MAHRAGDPKDGKLHHRHCSCARCEAASALPAHEVEWKLSALAGAAVWLDGDDQQPACGEERGRPYSPRSGLLLRGATGELARLCGFRHPDGRCYFTGPKILWLLSRKEVA
jgi:hypothetical protein